MEVAVVPALRDNYIFLAHGGGATAVIDPGEAAPALAEAERRGWRITHVLATHWHPDHVGGLQAVKAATGALAIGPAAEAGRIPGLDRTVGEGDEIDLLGERARVLDVRAHTAGHIAWLFLRAGVGFVGDTLFAMGCGRLLEGTAEQMHAALARLAALPPETRLYFAHEYTEANGRFAQTVEPDNAALAARVEEVHAARARGEPTTPTTVALERATNPFVRARDAGELALRRAAKDRA